MSPIISQKIKEKLQDLAKRGIIRRSNSPYASPFLVAAKGNGDFRLVADYRKLDKNIIGNAWTIPNIEMSLANLSRQKFFSQKEDPKEAFYGVELTEESIPKSAIITTWGLFEYLRSNFGIKDSMNVYCKMISSVLENMKPNQIINYVDVNIIIEETFDTHPHQALEAFENAGLIIRIENCRFLTKEKEFRAQVISDEGIEHIESQIEAILNIP